MWRHWQLAKGCDWSPHNIYWATSSTCWAVSRYWLFDSLLVWVSSKGFFVKLFFALPRSLPETLSSLPKVANSRSVNEELLWQRCGRPMRFELRRLEAENLLNKHRRVVSFIGYHNNSKGYFKPSSDIVVFLFFVLLCIFSFLFLFLKRICRLGDRATTIVATLVFCISRHCVLLAVITF